MLSLPGNTHSLIHCDMVRHLPFRSLTVPFTLSDKSACYLAGHSQVQTPFILHLSAMVSNLLSASPASPDFLLFPDLLPSVDQGLPTADLHQHSSVSEADLLNRLIPDEVTGSERLRLAAQFWQVNSQRQRLSSRQMTNRTPLYIAMINGRLKGVVVPEQGVTESLLQRLYTGLLNLELIQYLQVLPPDQLLDLLSESEVTVIAVASGDGGDPDRETDGDQGPGLFVAGDFIQELWVPDLYEQSVQQKLRLLTLLRKRTQQAIASGQTELVKILRNRIMIIEADLSDLMHNEPQASANPAYQNLLLAGWFDNVREVLASEGPAQDEYWHRHPLTAGSNPGRAFINAPDFADQEMEQYEYWQDSVPGMVYAELKRRLTSLLQQPDTDSLILAQIISSLQTLAQNWKDFQSRLPARQVPPKKDNTKNDTGQRKSDKRENPSAGNIPCGKKVRLKQRSEASGDGNPEPEQHDHTYSQDFCFLCNDQPCHKRRGSQISEPDQTGTVPEMVSLPSVSIPETKEHWHRMVLNQYSKEISHTKSLEPTIRMPLSVSKNMMDTLRKKIGHDLSSLPPIALHYLARFLKIPPQICKKKAKYGDTITCLGVSAGRLVAGHMSGSVTWLDLDAAGSGSTEWLFPRYRHVERVYSLGVLPDGTVITSSTDGAILIWSPDHHKQSGQPDTLAKEDLEALIKILPNGRVISSTHVWAIKEWFVTTKKYNCISTSDGRGHTTCLELLPNDRVATGGRQGFVNVWNLPLQCCERSMEISEGNSVYKIRPLADDRLVFGTSLGKVIVWNLNKIEEENYFIRKERQALVLQGHTSDVESLIILPNEKIISNSPRDGSVYLWDLKKIAEECLRVRQGKLCHILKVEVERGTDFYTTYHNGERLLWHSDEMKSKRCVYKLDKSSFNSGLSLLPGGLVLTGSNKGEIKMWDFRDSAEGELIHTIKAYNDNSLMHDLKLETLTTGEIISMSQKEDEDDTLKLWDYTTQDN